jgi:DNA-binding NarL/FixJ family response regulator
MYLGALERVVRAIPGAQVLAQNHFRDLDQVRPIPDVVICDPSVEGHFRPDLIVQVKKSYPEAHLLILTTHGGIETVEAALLAGADSFMLKNDSDDIIRTGIELVCLGGNAFSHGTAGRFTTDTSKVPREASQEFRTRALSQREIQVLELVAKGHSDSEIGQLLSISVRTARQHVANVMHKLDARSRSEAVARLRDLNT